MAENDESQKRPPDEILTELATKTNGYALFAAIYPYFAYIPEGGTEGEYGTHSSKLELAAFHLLRNTVENEEDFPDPFQITAALNATDDLFYTKFNPMRDFEPGKEFTPLDHIARRTEAESSMIRGSAYPFQTEEKIRAVQQRFATFYQEKLGITPAKAVDIVLALVKITEEKGGPFMQKVSAAAKEFAEEWKQKPVEYIETEEAAMVFGSSFEKGVTAQSDLPISFDEVRTKTALTIEEWRAFLKIFGFGKESANTIENFEDTRKFPVVIFNDERVLMWDLSNAMDQLFARFESEIKKDQQKFDRYQTWRGDWLEEKAYQYLTSIFPKDCVFRTVDYPNPDGGTAEVDLVVYWEPFLLFFEAKAGAFRFESQMGDVGRLRTDLRKNIQEAFDQAKRAAQYFESTPNPQFTERDTQRVIPIAKNRIKKQFLCTVSLERFGQFASKLAALAPLGLFTESEYPWSVVLSDLQIIGEFVEHPDVFSHYIDRRLEVQKHEIHFEADELDFLGAYLKDRLSLKQFTENEKEKPSFVLMSGFSSDFDTHYNAFGNTRGEPVRINLADNIKKILAELRNRKNDISARYLAFLLLDLPGETLFAIADGFEKMWKEQPKPGNFRRCTVNCEGTAISILAAMDLPEALIHERTNFRAGAEKYRFKVDTGISFGIDLTKPDKYFYSMAYMEGPWQHDPKWEKALKLEPPSRFDKSSLPGRNDPCFCGSKIKFKKCCLSKIDIKSLFQN